MIIFLVSHLYTWIRTAPSRIQPLPGVQKFIFDAKFGIPTPRNLYFNMHDHNFGKWIYLDQDGSQQDPATASSYQESRINHSLLQMYLSI